MEDAGAGEIDLSEEGHAGHASTTPRADKLVGDGLDQALLVYINSYSQDTTGDVGLSGAWLMDCVSHSLVLQHDAEATRIYHRLACFSTGPKSKCVGVFCTLWALQPFLSSAPSALRALQPFLFSAPSALRALQPFLFSAPSALWALQPFLFSAPSALGALRPFLFPAPSAHRARPFLFCAFSALISYIG